MQWERRHCAATLEHLALATEFVEECADRFGLASKKKFGALIVVEEAFVNICSYAYPEGSGEVALACGADEEAFVLEVADTGAPFDLLSLPEPDTTLALMDREIGGLGVHFIRKLPDRVSYCRENGQNILRMVFNRREGGASGV
jgi:anti-sigma regulatory factor (Ser/Thr protein kinase)